MRVAAAAAASAVAKSAMMASPWRRSTRPPESSAACASASMPRSRGAIGSTCGRSLALTRANSTAVRRPAWPRVLLVTARSEACICNRICRMQASVKNVTPQVARARGTLQRLAQRASTVQVAADTGIHQSQVSRLLRGQFHRISRNVQVLLAYARQPGRAAAPRRAEAAKAAVIKAALRTWDATPEGAQALVRLLRS